MCLDFRVNQTMLKCGLREAKGRADDRCVCGRRSPEWKTVLREEPE